MGFFDPLTALHEAGHVVAAFVLGFSIESVTINRNGDALGATTLRGVPERFDDMDQLERYVVMLLAGRAAVVRAGVDETLAERIGGPNDLEAARDRLRVHGCYVDEVIVRLHRRANEIVDVRFESIRAVAEALATKRVLVHEDIVRLLDGSA
jgi:hypothetical protein